MEDLNKNQIVLLTLLVSFVTSIATGIMTVALLQEAPVEVTRNINRVVEKTIETVTPVLVDKPEKEVVTTTVVVKEEDLVIDSINKNINSLVRIKEKDGMTGESSFYGIGIITNKDGTVAADKKTVSNINSYVGVLNNGSEVSLQPINDSRQTNFIFFKVVEKNTDKNATTTKSSMTFVPATFADSAPKLGQTLVSIGGEENNSVAVGRVSSLDTKDSGTGTSTIKILSGINTDISSRDFVSGSPLFNLAGDIVGIKSPSDVSKTFLPVAVLKKDIASSETPKSSN